MAFRLKKNNEKIQMEIENGRLLVEATENNDVEKMEKLLENGASVNADEYNRTLFYKSRNYLTPLQIAAQKGLAGPVKLLIKYEAEIDACDRYDITPLHMAAEGGYYECLRLLLDAGANCGVASKYARYTSQPVPYPGATTALHLATKNKHCDCVKELILNGADYNATNQYGHTSLYIAARQGSEDIVLTHLRNAVGRDILSLPVKDSSDTPLHECVKLGMATAVRELLRYGSDPNHRNTSGYSPLHLSCHYVDNYNYDIVRDIIRHGYNTDINQPNAEPFTTCTATHINYTTGATALHYAVFKDSPLHERRPRLAAFLIAYGANFEACKNRHGQTLLTTELRSTSEEDTILHAITNALSALPSLDSMGICYTPQLKRINPVPAVKYKWYMNLRENPRNLQHYCRCAVRRVLGVPRIRRIAELPLPTTLKEYLLLEFDELRGVCTLSDRTLYLNRAVRSYN